MDSFKYFKIFIGIFYIIITSLFIISVFYFDLSNYFNPSFLIKNKNIIFSTLDQNTLLISVIYFIFSIIWVFFLGFGTPLVIFSGLAFGTIKGTFLTVLSTSIGATLLYSFVNFYCKNLVAKFLSKKYSLLKKNINQNEFIYFFSLRIIPGIPFPIKNILPIMFNMKLKNYFLATFFGGLIPTAISVNIYSSITDTFKNNENLNLNIIFSPKIIFSLLALAVLSLIANYIKKKYFKI